MKNLRGTWRQALLTFFMPVLVVVGIRWLLFEPFVIPSGSMIPTLQIHDHIFVNKLSFGIQMPFANRFLIQWAHPRAGDVVVFRYPENPDVFYVKRVLAVGGDEISIEQGVVSVNGVPNPQEAFDSEETDNDFEYFFEKSNRSYTVRYLNKEGSYFGPFQVPDGTFFVMGDNRDQSNDSRYWGVVPESNLIGRARVVWLSCEQTLVTAQFLCDPSTIRWDRLLKKVE